MATNRYISTNFWKDNYIVDLDPTEKILFIYFLTNPKTNIAGIYEINLREVAFDTGIDRDMVQKILERFQADHKMFYQNGWLILRNWIKHQTLNPSILKGIDNHLHQLPDWLKDFVLTDDKGNSVGIDYDSLSTGSIDAGTYLIKSNLIKSNLIKSNGARLQAANGLAAGDEIGKLYYQVIEAYKLPVRNHRNVKAAIAKMAREGEDEANSKYLMFLITQYRDLMFDKKPELSEALDIYNKRNQILNGVRRQTIKPSGRGFRV